MRIAPLLASSVLLLAAPARADRSTIKQPGNHPDYVFEAEPHLIVAPFEDFLPGAGFRGTIELVDNGFVQTINNTVGIGFGADFVKDRVWIPVVMQWNFWLSENWSVFGEPGGALRLGKGSGVKPVGYGGARFHFSDHIALTLRVGHPAFSVGVSFLL
jgi:hypothetical protein